MQADSSNVCAMHDRFESTINLLNRGSINYTMKT